MKRFCKICYKSFLPVGAGSTYSVVCSVQCRKELARQIARKYYKDNKEHCKEYNKSYKDSHKDIRKKQGSDYYTANHDKISDGRKIITTATASTSKDKGNWYKIWTLFEDNKIIELKKSGKTALEVAKIVGRTINSIEKRFVLLRKKGLLT